MNDTERDARTPKAVVELDGDRRVIGVLVDGVRVEFNTANIDGVRPPYVIPAPFLDSGAAVGLVKQMVSQSAQTLDAQLDAHLIEAAANSGETIIAQNSRYARRLGEWEIAIEPITIRLSRPK